MKMRSLYILISALSLAIATPTPIVLWHGMGDTCCQIFSLRAFQVYLKKQLPNVYTLSLKVGNNTIEDLENGFFMHPNKQVDYVCELLKKDDNLKQGFNVIGFSQGSQFSRAVIQRCGHQLPPIKSFISLGGQHQGVYGLPHCSYFSPSTCKYMSSLLNHAAYLRWVQESLVQATYWHDPLDETTYKTGSTFLSDINNEMRINKTYIDNLSRIQKFVMVKFTNDSIVSPVGTEWFGFYAPGQADRLLPLQKMAIYKQDRLGLKKMDQNGKLVFLEALGDHLHLTNEWLNNNIIPYLKN